MHPQPMIVVHNVEASSLWYQDVLGLESGHGGNEYEQLMFAGKLVLQLHHWDTHEHPHTGNETLKPYGNGALLWFQTDQFDAAVERILASNATILEQPKVNPNANHREIWLQDPDGYKIVVASPYDDV